MDHRGCVRVSNFSIDKRVRELHSPNGEDLDDRFPVAIGRGAKKVDIYRLGLLALSLAMGEIVQEPSVPINLNPDFADFLKKCLDRDEHERWSSGQLLEHSWIKIRVEKPLITHFLK